MKIAFISKRQYMGNLHKDVILDRYGRLYEIPFQLAQLGHDVRGFCLSYQGGESGTWEHEINSATGCLVWESAPSKQFRAFGLLAYPFKLLQKMHAFQPDIIVGASDIPHVAMARWLSHHLHINYAVDLYDNFESFGQARIPGMIYALRKAARDAKLVITASDQIKEQVQSQYHVQGQVLCLPNFIDKSVFYPKDKIFCRRTLGLPDDAVLVGTAGGLMRDRGIGLLYRAWEQQAPKSANLHLVLAGPSDIDVPSVCSERVHYLGVLSQENTADLFNALDVGVIYLANTNFGRYCFPQKTHEMLSCRLPVVAANLGAMTNFLKEMPEALYGCDNADDLVRAIMWQIGHKMLPNIEVSDWKAEIKKIHDVILC